MYNAIYGHFETFYVSVQNQLYSKSLLRKMHCMNLDYITFTNVQKMHATLLNSKVSKVIRNQGETLFCWAFAISTMLRQSLNLFIENFLECENQNDVEWNSDDSQVTIMLVKILTSFRYH